MRRLILTAACALAVAGCGKGGDQGTNPAAGGPGAPSAAAAAGSVTNVGSVPETVNQLLQAVRGAKEIADQERAVAEVQQAGQVPSAVSALAAIVQNDAEAIAVRDAAAFVLGLFGPEAQAAIAALESAKDNVDDPEVERTIRLALQKIRVPQ